MTADSTIGDLLSQTLCLLLFACVCLVSLTIVYQPVLMSGILCNMSLPLFVYAELDTDLIRLDVLTKADTTIAIPLIDRGAMCR